jgi:hypothetical protein
VAGRHRPGCGREVMPADCSLMGMLPMAPW